MRYLLFGCLLMGCTWRSLPLHDDDDAGPARPGDQASGPSDQAVEPVDAADLAVAATDLAVAVDDLAVAVDDLAVASADLSPALDLGCHDAGGTPASPTLPLFDGTVTAIVHAGSSYYVGGRFTRITPHAAPRVLALDPSGTPTGCPLGSGFDGQVFALVQSGSSLYAGGLFTHYQGASAKGIAKIDVATCALDTTFSPPANNGFDGWVGALAVTGSSLYVGGGFTAYRGVANSANELAKLDLASGALDTTFSPPGATSNGFDGLNSGAVSAFAVEGTSLYVGGGFTAYRGVAGSANRIAKLDLTSGALDTTFTPVGNNGFDATVKAIAVSGGALYVGGFFTAYKGVLSSANGLAKLDLATGAIDTTFSPVGPTTNGVSPPDVYALAVSGSSLYVGGDFTTYRGVSGGSAYHLVKLDVASGAIDTTFSPVGAANNGFNGRVDALAVSSDSLYVGGNFTAYRGVAGSAYDLAKLDLISGAIDNAFLPADSKMNGVSDPAVALFFAGSTLWVGGYFQVYAGYPANHLVKLDDATLAVDTTFSPAESNGFNSWVNALAVSGDALFVGGTFSAYRGVANSANRLAKLDRISGALDTSFGPAGTTSNGLSTPFPGQSSVRALAVAGTSLYVGGAFTAYKGVASSANSLAKLDVTSGAIDTTFSPTGATSNGFANAQVDALAASGTSLYVGGNFTAYKGVANSANHLAKLDLATGDIDATFSPPGVTANGFDTGNANGHVYALVVAGSALYAGGEFTAYRGVANSANALAKLDLVSGDIDTTFSPPGSNNNGFIPSSPYVAVLALASDGTSLYVGGWDLTGYRGVPDSANSIAKLDLISGAIDTTFSPVGASSNGFGVSDSVWALAVSGGALCVGGDLSLYRGANVVSDFAWLDPTSGATK